MLAPILRYMLYNKTMKDELYQIGSLANKASVNIQTIRYYERIKLLTPKIRKDAKRVRYYNDESLKILNFIKHAQELGFSLAEIKDLLELRTNKESRCDGVQVRAIKHLEDVEEKIKKLERIQFVLSKLIRQCRSKKTNDSCPILNCFEKE